MKGSEEAAEGQGKGSLVGNHPDVSRRRQAAVGRAVERNVHCDHHLSQLRKILYRF